MVKQRTFLKLDGIAGTSNVAGHAGEIGIYQVKLIESSKGNEPKLALNFVKSVDSTTPWLLGMVQNGGIIEKAVAIIETAEHGKILRSYRIEMENVRVWSFQNSRIRGPFDGFDGPDEPPEVTEVLADVVSLDIGMINNAQVLAMIGTDLLSHIGL